MRDVSFSLKAGEVLAIVGESGCGKSVLCKSILRLLPQTAKIKSGKIIVDGTDITAYREREMTALRGSLFSMVFQDPMTALDPTMTIGVQIAEAVLAHKPKLEKSAVRARVIELLELVGIDRAQERMALYPHNFSGGMRQRVVLAIALAGNPHIPLAVVVLGHLWYYAYMIRNRLLDEMRADYVLLAKAKGLTRRAVMLRHCLRNTMPTYLSIMAISVPHVLGGTYIVETVFSYPGLGTLAYESARYKDYNLLMLLSLLSGALVILCSIIAQTINEQIDPRIRAEQAVREAEVQP